MSTEGLGGGRGLLTGEVFAGFRIEEVLGRGGMGWVYRVHDLALDRERALKVLDPNLARDEAFRGRFQRESKMAAAIEHPAVVPVYQAGEEDERLFIVMRLVRGPDLQKLVVTEGPLDARRTARIIAAVAGGLDAAHAHGIVHRDVKPANILLELGNEGERVYLTDFGIGRPSEAGSALTQTGDVIGTADYIAPEQIRGHRADARSDVYTLGCVVCFLLTGEPPFARENQLATLFAHANAERPRPSLLEPGLPEAIDDVVVRATAIEPDERHQSAGELAGALTQAAGPSRTSMQTAAAATTASAETPPIPPALADPETRQIPPPPKRPRPSWIPLALIGVIAVGVVAFILLSGGDDGGGADDSTTTTTGGQDELRQLTSVEAFEVTAGAPASALAAGTNNVLVLAEGESSLFPVEPGTGAPAREPIEIPAPSAIAIGFGGYWVTSRSEGELFSFGPGSRETGTAIPVGRAPSDVATDPGAATEDPTVPQVWVANEGDSTLSRVNPVSLTEDATAGLDDPPSAVAVGDGGVWALSEAAGTVTRVDPGGASVAGEPVDLEGSPVDLAVDGSVWVIDASANALVELTPALKRAGQPTELPGRPVAITTGREAIWVATTGPNRLLEIDPGTAQPVAEAEIDGEPTAVSVPPPDSVDASSIWVATADGAVARVRP